MTPRRRAFIGGAFGALLVLLANPLTRPGLLAAFRPLPRGGLPALVTRPALAPPTDVVKGAAYLHVGAGRIARKSPLKADETASLIAICQEGARNEPDNAFWPMARFVFLGGRSREALSAWQTASRCRIYNDHQSQTLEQDRNRIAGYSGGIQAWIYSAVAPQRSSAMAKVIVETVQRTQKGVDSITLSYQTIRNGAMLRDGSRRLALGQYGIALIEGATYPSDLGPSPTPRRLWVAKTDLTGKLRRAKMVGEAAYCDRQFRINDSWYAFQDVEDPKGRFITLSIAASIVDALPGALLAAALAGGLVWLFGLRIGKIAEKVDRFRGPGLTACSLTLLVVAAFLGYPVVGITAGICALVPALAPERPRHYDGGYLGPFHAFTVGFLTVGLVLGVGLAAIARSLPGQILPSQGMVGAWLGDAPRLGAFVVILLGGSALVAPAWAIVRRFGTPAIANVTYQGMGRGTALVGVTLAILFSPISLAIDRLLGDHLGKIALNEQVYYNPSDTGGP